jgi:hypothetical protein
MSAPTYWRNHSLYEILMIFWGFTWHYPIQKINSMRHFFSTHSPINQPPITLSHVDGDIYPSPILVGFIKNSFLHDEKACCHECLCLRMQAEPDGLDRTELADVFPERLLGDKVRQVADVEGAIHLLRWKSQTQRIKIHRLAYIFSIDFLIHRLVAIFLWIFGCCKSVSAMLC